MTDTLTDSLIDNSPTPPPVLDRAGATEVFASTLGGLLGGRAVAAGDHFFDDLGANSMTMAHFCAKVRKLPGLPPISMRDVYAHPRIDGLVTALVPVADLEPVMDEVEPPGPDPDSDLAPAPLPPAPAHLTPMRARHTASTAAYVACGAAQLLIFIGYSYLITVLVVPGFTWIAAGTGLLDVYLRSVVVGSATFLGLCLLPVIAKWLLIGRWKPTVIPVWSLRYLRFWVVRALLRINPMTLFVGNPIYVWYLRLLGARIGRNVTFLSKAMPVCTDLLTIGDGAIVRKEAVLLGYRAVAGLIHTGPVTIGARAFVGEKVTLDIESEVGDDAQLGHTSSLQRGGRVPSGARWHGSPAEPTSLDYNQVPALPALARRRIGYALVSLVQSILIFLPVSAGGGYLIVTQVPLLASWLVPGPHPRWFVLLEAVVLSLAIFVSFLVVGLLLMYAVPRIAARLVVPGQVYPLYGPHYELHRTVTQLTNRKFFGWLFGDSSYITGYLSWLGWDLGKVEQTGSNFGTEMVHEVPTSVRIGPGTMVADGLSVMNTDYSASSFQVTPVTLGASSFLGNHIAYPAGARVGDNCLLATKVLVPLDGPVREGVGLLGSPAFEIPRTVERDASFDHLREGTEFEVRLRAKNRYNATSMAIMLTLRWLQLFGLSAIGLVLLDLYDGVAGQLLLAAYAPAGLLFTALFWITVERTITRFRPLRPQLCSIYEPYFWWHERLWKVLDSYLGTLGGTPFKNLAWRALGVKVGRRVFDDGALATERTLTEVGDDATLNSMVKIQCHSQEDGTFKSDRTVIGAHATLGVNAFVHYGVTIGEGAVIGADSFVMKGEQVPDHAEWVGNPAGPLRRPSFVPVGSRRPALVGSRS